MKRVFVGAWLLLGVVCVAQVGCKKSAGAGAADGAADANDGAVDATAVACPAVEGELQDDGGTDGGTVLGVDEFGPNAPAAKAASSLGRVNIFEVTSASMLERLDVYLQADLPHTRVTIAIQEALSRTAVFTKLTEVQIDFGVCRGWATSGPLAIPLRAGRFYAMGFDPNQVVTPFVSTDADSLPIDGMFGRLMGSRTATSVSIPTLTWEKFLDKEYNRQRVVTSPREPDVLDVVGVDAGGDASGADGADANRDVTNTDTATDGGVGDGNRDAAATDASPADMAPMDTRGDGIIDGAKG